MIIIRILMNKGLTVETNCSGLAWNADWIY